MLFCLDGCNISARFFFVVVVICSVVGLHILKTVATQGKATAALANVEESESAARANANDADAAKHD